MKQARINLEIPEALKRQFKATAARRGKSMTEILIDYINKTVRRGKETK